MNAPVLSIQNLSVALPAGGDRVHAVHQVSLDSQGNIYTAEVDTGKRIQKFVRYGAVGCSGTGSETVGGVAVK